MVQDIGTTRNSKAKVIELNHLKKKMKRLEKGQESVNSGKEALG